MEEVHCGSSLVPETLSTSNISETGEDDSPRPEVVVEDEKLINPTYKELEKLCVDKFIFGKLTYSKLNYLMKLYYRENAQIVKECRRKSYSSSKLLPLMSKTILTFHYMYQDIKKNVTLDSLYYQSMSDLLSVYIDLELKASEIYADDYSPDITSRIIAKMQEYLDRQLRYQLDTILKTKCVRRQFQEISSLIISRIIRNHTSKELSDVAYIRSVLVFKLWASISKNKDEKKKILKLASHFAIPPQDLMENPSQLIKEMLPCNYRKTLADLTKYIILDKYPLRKKIEIFLTETKIRKTPLPRKPHHTCSAIEKKEKNTFQENKAFNKICDLLEQVIVLERKNRFNAKVMQNNRFKYLTDDYLTDSNCSKNSLELIPSINVHNINNDVPLDDIKSIKVTKSVTTSTQTTSVTTSTQTTSPQTTSTQTTSPQITCTQTTSTQTTSPQTTSTQTTITQTTGVTTSTQTTGVTTSTQTTSESKNDQLPIMVRSAASVAKFLEGSSPNRIAAWHIPENIDIFRNVNGGSNQVMANKTSQPANLASMTPTFANKQPSSHCSLPPLTIQYPVIETHSDQSVDKQSSSQSRLPLESDVIKLSASRDRERNIRSETTENMTNQVPRSREVLRATRTEYFPPKSNKSENEAIIRCSFNDCQDAHCSGLRKNQNLPPPVNFPVPNDQLKNVRQLCLEQDKGLLHHSAAKSSPQMPRIQEASPHAQVLWPPLAFQPHHCLLPHDKNYTCCSIPQKAAINTTPVSSSSLSNSQLQGIPSSSGTNSSLNPILNGSTILQNFPHFSTTEKEIRAVDNLYNSNAQLQNTLIHSGSTSNEIERNLTHSNTRLPPYSSLRPRRNLDIPLAVTSTPMMEWGSTNMDSHNVTYSDVSTPAPNSMMSCQKNDFFFESIRNEAVKLLTRINELGYLEYNFRKMPIPSDFKYFFISALRTYDVSSMTTDAIITLLSHINDNFLNETNECPPQLIKVNNNKINKRILSISKQQSKLHSNTIKKDNLTFISQEKFRNFYYEGKEPLLENLMLNSDFQYRCYCLQCITNNVVLHVNNTILKYFRTYLVSKGNIGKVIEDRINTQQRKSSEAAKRSLEISKEGGESPLPLKKRKSATPPVFRYNDSEISYPSTPMISIAQLEANKNTTSINGNISSFFSNSFCASSVTEQNSSNLFGIDRNTSANTLMNPVLGKEQCSYIQYFDTNRSSLYPAISHNVSNPVVSLQNNSNPPGSTQNILNYPGSTNISSPPVMQNSSLTSHFLKQKSKESK